MIELVCVRTCIRVYVLSLLIKIQGIENVRDETSVCVFSEMVFHSVWKRVSSRDHNFWRPFIKKISQKGILLCRYYRKHGFMLKQNEDKVV